MAMNTSRTTNGWNRISKSSLPVNRKQLKSLSKNKAPRRTLYFSIPACLSQFLAGHIVAFAVSDDDDMVILDAFIHSFLLNLCKSQRYCFFSTYAKKSVLFSCAGQIFFVPLQPQSKRTHHEKSHSLLDRYAAGGRDARRDRYGSARYDTRCTVQGVCAGER